MNPIILTTGQLKTKTYILKHPNSAKCLIIDPGDDAEFIIENIDKNDLKPVAILATHGHFDHAMAAWQLQKFYNIPFFIDPKDQFLLGRITSTTQKFLGVVAIAPEETYDLNDQKFKSLEKDFGFITIPTPGHTPGSNSFYFPNLRQSLCHSEDYNQSEESGPDLPRHPEDPSIDGDEGSHPDNPKGAVFSGDLIFGDGSRGRTDFSYCNENDLYESIKTILKLPGQTTIFCGHGKLTTVQDEKEFYLLD